VKALIMAAGYGTRLYPITKDTPKPMLEVGDRPMIDHIVDKLSVVDQLDELLVVTNDKFHEDFQEWSQDRDFPWPVTVLNDGSTEDGEKRGAIGDIHFTAEEADVEDDLIVLAGDNLFDFNLNDMVETFESVQDNVVGVLRFDDEEKLSKYGIVAADDDGQIVDFQEKPEEPPSNLVAMGMYLFPGEKLSLIEEYLESGGNPDEPGWYITWLVENDSAHAHAFEGNWFDIGDKDSLQQADEFLTKQSIH
jgi:glucose-1-phosphate thymidylyltransferase